MKVFVQQGILALAAVSACAASHAADQASSAATSTRIDVRSISLVKADDGRVQTGGDARAADIATFDPGIVTVTGYEVLPDGQIMVRCRQSGPQSLQGAVLQRRVTKELLR